MIRRAAARHAPCPVCGSRGAARLAAPLARSMLSDGALCGVALERLACRRCGAAWLLPAQAARLPRRTFGANYALGAAPPSAADLDRAGAYATRIGRLWSAAPPATVLDVGCGNGALLTRLGALWPGARLRGVEPAPRVAAAARAAGLAIAPTLRPGHRAALVLSVNVVEHTPDPVAFLRALRRAVAPGGRALVICPDGGLPWLELLMADHRWSLTQTALVCLARRAGFRVEAAEAAPAGFQALLLSPAPPARPAPPRRHHPLLPRRLYLGHWRALERRLEARISTSRSTICFGVGEAARLLRAYAPGVWTRVAAVSADDPAGAEGLDRTMIPPEEIVMPRDEILLAVRPAAQGILAERLAARGVRAIRWDDVVAR